MTGQFSVVRHIQRTFHVKSSFQVFMRHSGILTALEALHWNKICHLKKISQWLLIMRLFFPLTSRKTSTPQGMLWVRLPSLIFFLIFQWHIMLLINRIYAMENHLNRFQIIWLSSVCFLRLRKTIGDMLAYNYVEIVCKPQNQVSEFRVWILKTLNYPSAKSLNHK